MKRKLKIQMQRFIFGSELKNYLTMKGVVHSQIVKLKKFEVCRQFQAFPGEAHYKIISNLQIIIYLNHRMFPFTSQYYMQQCLTEMSYLNSFNSCFYSPSQVYYMASPTQILNYDLPPNKISELYEQTQSPLSGSERLEKQLMENSSSSISNENEILREVRRQKKVCRVKEEAKQKFGRNICSNIFHLMVKFVKKQKKMKAMVGKIIQQNKMSIKTNQFYQFFKNKCYKLKSYANFAKIEQFWKGINISPSQSNSKNQKQIECAKIFRILGRVYLHYHHFPYVYNSLKIKGESKRLHTEGLRRILSL